MESAHSSTSNLKRSPRTVPLSNLSLSDPINGDVDTYMAEQGHDDITPLSIHPPAGLSSKPTPSGPEKYQTITAKKERSIKAGETWYIVEKKWYDRWRRACTGDFGKHEPVQESDIQAVDNSELMENGYLLSAEIVEGVNFELIPDDAWELLVQWYVT
jgi:ubiquitin carboxyl-terminal hydrolase 4/11